MTIRLPATPFIGRARELSSLANLLADPVRRLVTVVGAPGVGKTRLALEAARRSAGRFSDGVVEVSLAALRDTSQVAPTLLAAAGGIDIGTTEPVSQLVRALGSNRALLVVDNAEHLLDCGTLLGELVGGCPELTVLVTSRQPLGLSGERVLALSPFDAPDPGGLGEEQLRGLEAVALLSDRLQAAGTSLDGSTETLRRLAGICRLVDGLPLAIELAAARGRVQSVPGIRTELERRRLRLDRGPRDAEPRHRTMRDAIAWSLELLDARSARTFAHTSVFASGWTLDGLAAVLPGTGEAELAGTLDDLVDRSLVLVEPGDGCARYRMLEVVREFAFEQLRPDDRDAASRRHAGHLLQVATAAAAFGGADLLGSLDRLEAERDNLRGALRWAVSAGDTATAEGLCLAQRMLWYVRGPLHEGCDAFEAALALAPEDLARRSRVLAEAAALERQRGRLGRAASLAEEATVFARRAGDQLVLAGALLQQGFVAHLSGEFDRARALLEESAGLADGRDEVAVARALHHLGLVLHFGGGLDVEAADLQRRALEIYRAHGNLRQVATLQVGIAELERCRGDLGAAHEAMSEALRVFSELGDLPVLSYALQEAASIAATEGRHDRALRLLGAADRVEAITGAPTWPVLLRASEGWLPGAVAALGAARAAQLRQSGSTLEPRQAIAFAGGDEDEAAAEHRLSRREREVACLVADGLTNREIGARLFLSERTVDGHVARILGKLDFRSRTQIATWVSLGGVAGPGAGRPRRPAL